VFLKEEKAIGEGRSVKKPILQLLVSFGKFERCEKDGVRRVTDDRLSGEGVQKV